jgi:hypothetical protein
MKIYVVNQGVVLAGKAWEIREKLKEYNKQFYFVQEWIDATRQFPQSQHLSKNKPFRYY